jgi:hypothetical protein
MSATQRGQGSDNGDTDKPGRWRQTAYSQNAATADAAINTTTPATDQRSFEMLTSGLKAIWSISLTSLKT